MTYTIPGTTPFVISLLIVAWLAVCAIFDTRTRQVPNWLRLHADGDNPVLTQNDWAGTPSDLRPEARQLPFHLIDGLHDLKSPPVGREQLAVTRMGKTLIDQDDDAAIGLGANDPPGRLQHPVEAWILVSIGKTSPVLAIEILFDQ
ncbi:MAG TPA: hypothetical protein VLM83_09000, partial [Anaerolineales bacterium]|nr:hypothetical protein [Anaerolineales bacterium]